MLAPAPAFAASGVIPYATYTVEQKEILGQLPCKWISMGGRIGPSHGGGRYDLLCKGGTWGTVSLFLDRKGADGIGNVRFIYTDWNPQIHPNAGEAVMAEVFLQHILNRLVPATLAKSVREAFWDGTADAWIRAGVRVTVSHEEKPNQVWRKVEISGMGRPTPGLTRDDSPMFERPAVSTGLVQDTPPANTDDDTRVQAPIHILPKPGAVPMKPSAAGEGLAVPDSAPASAPKALIPAAPAELNTAPAAETLVPIKAPPVISASLVPDADMLTRGRAKAPSNFDFYNKAEALTRAEEIRALGTVTATTPGVKPVVRDGSAVQAPPAVSGPSVAPMDSPAAAAPVASPVVPPAAAPALPQDKAPRALPQLQFVPRAEPLDTTKDVIQFEDDKSAL